MVGVVNKDDHIYFSHKSGPKSGRVLCHGKHGAVVRCDENKRHKVRWEQVLGHKERVEHRLKMVDCGEDGAIVEHEDGRRAFVAGEIPKAEAYQDKAATFDPPGDGDLVTRGIERAMEGRAVYQVIDGEIPDGNVIVAAEKPLELVKFLAEHKMEPGYEIAARVVIRNGEESGHGGLVVFDAEDGEVEGLVNAIAAFQRSGVGFDEVIVMGRRAGGMAPVTVSTKKISGKTVLVLGERQGFDAVEAFASPDMVEMMRKSLVFFKAHIKGYTRRDGGYVAAHEDKRPRAKPRKDTRSDDMFGLEDHQPGDDRIQTDLSSPKPVNPTLHPNDWVRGAADYWNSMEALQGYLDDVRYDLRLTERNHGLRYAHDRELNTELATAVEVIAQRLRGLEKQNDSQSQRQEETRAKDDAPVTYWRGDKARYTGRSEEFAGGVFYEIELLEGHLKGEKKLTQRGPGGLNKSVVLFKAGSVANRPGLSLQEVTDKRGHQTHKWKRTGQDAKPERERRGSAKGYGAHNIEAGDTVVFERQGAKLHGKVLTAGKDGATVEDPHGGEHRVLWADVRGHAPGKKEDHSKPGEALGKQEPVPAEVFAAHDYYARHNDPEITPESIIAQFPPDTADKIKAAQDRLESVEQTIDRYKKDDAYNAERLVLHDKIINEILSEHAVRGASPTEGKAPTFMVLGGRGGSGKSKFKGTVYDPSKFLVLDADAIKERLPEYEGWNAFQVHEESGDLFDKITSTAQRLGLNIVHDATMKSQSKVVALVNRFKAAGYRTEAHYMHLPRQEAAKRAVSRFLGKTSRYVPVEVVLSNTSNEASFDAIKDLVDKWSFRDNNVGKDASPVLISEWERGKESEQDERGKEVKKSHEDGQVDHGQRREAGRSGLRPAGVQESLEGVYGTAAGTDQKTNRRKAGSLKKAVIYFDSPKRQSIFRKIVALIGIK